MTTATIPNPPSEWVSKLGTLDTETYPWQLALIEELMHPFKAGQDVLFVDKYRARRLLPWEEIDDATGYVTCVNYCPGNLTRYDVHCHKQGEDKRSVVMIDNKEYLKILRYFFDKGVFND